MHNYRLAEETSSQPRKRSLTRRSARRESPNCSTLVDVRKIYPPRVNAKYRLRAVGIVTVFAVKTTVGVASGRRKRGVKDILPNRVPE